MILRVPQCQNGEFLTFYVKSVSESATFCTFLQKPLSGSACPGLPLIVKRWRGPIKGTRASKVTEMSLITRLFYKMRPIPTRGFLTFYSNSGYFTELWINHWFVVECLRRVGIKQRKVQLKVVVFSSLVKTTEFSTFPCFVNKARAASLTRALLTNLIIIPVY